MALFGFGDSNFHGGQQRAPADGSGWGPDMYGTGFYIADPNDPSTWGKGGLSNANDPGYGGNPNVQLLTEAFQPGMDWNSGMQRFLSGFRGDASSIPKFLQDFAPFYFGNLLQTPEAQRIQDPNQFLASTYEPAANQIEAGGEANMRQMRGSMANQGLDAGGMMPMLQAQMQAQSAGQRGDLKNRALTDQAYGSWGLTRDVAGMGFGYAPSQQKQGFDWGPVAAAAGGVAGQFIGSSGFGGKGK